MALENPEIQEVNTLENPTDNVATINAAEEAASPVRSEGYIQTKATELAVMMMSADSNLTMDKAYADAKGIVAYNPDLPSVYQGVINSVASKISETAQANLLNLANENPDLVVLGAEIGRAVREFNETEMQGYNGIGNSLVTTASRQDPVSYPRDVLFNQFQAAKQSANSILADHLEQQGTWNSVTSFAGALFNPEMFIDTQQLADSVGEDLNFEQVVQGFQNLPPTEQKRVFPELFAKAVDAFDNNEYHLSWFVDTLYNPEAVSGLGTRKGLAAIEQAAVVPVSIAMAPFKIIKGVGNVANRKRKLQEIGMGKEAAKESINGTLDEVDLDKALDASAFRWEDITSTAADDYAGLYSRVVKEASVTENSFQTIKQLAQKSGIKGVSAADANKAQADFKEKLMKQVDVNDIEIFETSPTGFKAKVSMNKGDDIVIQEYKYTKDDVTSVFTVENSSFTRNVVGSKVLSPTTQFHSIADELVDEATFGGFQAAKLNNQLQEAWKRTGAGLSKEANQKADELIEAGDELEEIFTLQQLKSGEIQTASGKRPLTDDEIVGYYNKVAFNKEMFGLANYTIKRKLEFLGFKEAFWKTANGDDMLALVKPRPGGQGFTNQVDDLIYVPGHSAADASGLVPRGSITIKEMEALGYTPVQFYQPFKVGNRSTEWGMVKTGDNTGVIRDLPDKLLHETTGYAPRIAVPGLYYVKDARTGRTFKRFRKKENAQAWADEQNAKQADAEIPNNEQIIYQPVRDRDFTTMEAISEDANVFGGLIYGARNTDGIAIGDDLAGRQIRLSTSQSIQRVNQSISNVMPVNQFKMGMVQKWKNTAKKTLEDQGLKSDSPIFRQIDDAALWTDVPLDAITDANKRAALESIRKYMIDQFSIPTNKENAWNKFMMDAADRMTFNDTLHDSLVTLANKDPLRSLKGATFNLMLGWFNPRQLYVQAQNASLAISMYPIQGLKAATKAMHMRPVMLLRKDPEALEAYAKKIGDDDLVDNIRQLDESGLLDSIYRNADYDANSVGFTNGAWESLRKMSEKGLIFYREGESFSRMIAWNVARLNWKEANPGKAIGRAEVKEITQDALRMNMNMQRENAASYQTNLATGGATQFFQPQAKLVENVIGGLLGKGKWTRAEASKVLAGQIMLYGTGGVIIADEMAEHFKGAVDPSGNPVEFDFNNPNTAELINEGMVGVMANALGFENNFSKSGSLLAGLDDNIITDLLFTAHEAFTGEKNVNSVSALEAFLGPSGTTIKRGGDVLMETAAATYDIIVHPTLETTSNSVLKSIDSLASLTSTWSNARKVIFLHNVGGILDSKGNIILSEANLADVNTRSMIAKAFGIPLDMEDAYWENRLWNFDRKKQLDDSLKALKQTYLDFQMDGNKELFKAKASALLGEYETQPLVRQELMNTFLRQVTDPKSKKDRDIQRFINDYVRSGGEIGFKSFQADLITNPQEGQN